MRISQVAPMPIRFQSIQHVSKQDADKIHAKNPGGTYQQTLPGLKGVLLYTDEPENADAIHIKAVEKAHQESLRRIKGRKISPEEAERLKQDSLLDYIYALLFDAEQAAALTPQQIGAVERAAQAQRATALMSVEKRKLPFEAVA